MTQTLTTRIWREEAEPGNAFAARAAFCHGYDVFGEMLGRARWVDMLWLLFRGDVPPPEQAALLEDLAVALANPGPRDPAVHAAMCAGTGGSTAAASLMAALAVGAGQQGGAREVFHAMALWQRCGTDLAAWAQVLAAPAESVASIWPDFEHAPGFDPNASAAGLTVLQTLAHLARGGVGHRLGWLDRQRAVLEGLAAAPLAMTGVAAAALSDLGLTPDQGEILFLLLRLPGAAVHALEQRALGPKHFPFFELDLLNDPVDEVAA
ncbi:citryl-CoA lyase [Roseateles saccharophilus]|uniref:Citrate synthase n=1 Tax=Roseateles saccharophilus TaxID=304 RepID=A0A4R3VIX5_ROSSA|nr:citryl-CoA lyase [Roseateles saccharophilus]MDG0834549.1 citryl-CoA lyase [Roseateles saccharophilus]TCV03758.1 citrate synthase [Roseateles saccharophilus]